MLDESKQQYEKIEKKELKSFEEIKKEIEELREKGEYKNELIRRTIKEKKKLRKTYLALILTNPSRIGEIQQKAFSTRNTLYSHLYELIELGLAKQIAVLDLWNRKDLNESEEEVIKKFKDWTSKMTKRQLQNFVKTNYFVLTDLGKNSSITNWTLKVEKEALKNAEID